MKKLAITWDGVDDATGYLFSLAKALSAAVKNSPYADLAEEIVATSGFAFRMWLSADLCRSATSIWSWDDQQRWVENGGLHCDYVGRYWGQDDQEEAQRLKAIERIRTSIDQGIAAISWDIGVPEWGLITGYDDASQTFATLSVTGEAAEMSYDALGKREIPILSVLTLTGKSEKSREAIQHDTLQLAVSHLQGEEWCDNAKGLEVYPALIKHYEEATGFGDSSNAEYFLGTYAPLKQYAYKYFEKAHLPELAELYQTVYQAWLSAFTIKKNEDASLLEVRTNIASLLKTAYEKERRALEIMVGRLR
ncbi:hypothetical protein [Gorillibacterium timonense]|uniref:hypothetical protein n=1 Tax=Gorillibacterium timonense TaxID=1689269 RepID=UPI000D529154|nr:hypothetical protein [Gorillibacterium timonense]